MHTLKLYCQIVLSLCIFSMAPWCAASEPMANSGSAASSATVANVEPVAATGFPFTSGPTKDVKGQPVNTNISLIKTFGGLTLVLGMIFLMAKIGKKFHPSLNTPDRALKIVSLLSLGTKEKVALIQVGSKQLLIGVTPQSINTLLDIDEPILPDAPAAGATKSILSARTASEFSRKLNEFLLAGQRNK